MSNSQSTDQARMPGEKNGKARRKGVIVVAALVVVGLVVLAYVRYMETRETSTDDAFIEGQIVMVSPRIAGHIASVEVADNQYVHKGDVLVRLDESDKKAKLESAKAEVAAAHAGLQQQEIAVKLAQVEADSSLKIAQAGVESAESARDEAQAQIDQAKADVAKSEATVNRAKEELEEARAEVIAAQARKDKADADLNRQQMLSRSGTISSAELDAAVEAAKVADADFETSKLHARVMEAALQEESATLDSDKATLTEKEAAFNTAKAAVKSAEANLTSAEAGPLRVEQAKSTRDLAMALGLRSKAGVDSADLDYAYTEIRAPISGYVTKKNAEVGAYVQAGMGLMSIVPDDVWVIANFKETQLRRMKVGQQVEISVDTHPGVEFKGHVDSFQRGSGARFSLLPPENATGNYVKVVQRMPVKIVFDEPEKVSKYFLAPGMSVEPTVHFHRPLVETKKNSAETKDASSAGNGS